jgi:hypothetical protein
MLYGFVISASRGRGEPGEEYFQAVETAAKRVVGVVSPDATDVIDLCEYLDCVDSGVIRSNPALYRETVAALSAYLDTCPRRAANALSNKSWAAKTLLDIICQAQSWEYGNDLRLA